MIPLDTPPVDVPATKAKPKTSWIGYSALIAETMTRVLKRRITPWTIAGPQSFVAKAFLTHGVDAAGKRLMGDAFRAWLVASIEAWLQWRRGIVDAREVPERLRRAWYKGEDPGGWVGWLDGGGAR